MTRTAVTGSRTAPDQLSGTRVLLFGTYDASLHPRVTTIAEGLRASGALITECNAPLGLSTADKVGVLRRPWRLPALLGRVGRRWATLIRAARRAPAPDVVLVGYMGHFDVHLARLFFRRVPIVLDHLVSAAGTARDRRLGGGWRQVPLRLIDSAALRAATVVVVDTDEHLAALPLRHRAAAMVIPVGAPAAWYDAAPSPGPRAATGPLRVVFYGLYTPLQGTPVIGGALAGIAGAPIEVTMIGTGQDEAETRQAAAACHAVRWLDWVPAADLPAVVADHDVCLGIFGTGDKALRVVPNKVFQGAAAGCAIVTSDTPPQRRALGDAAVLVPPGDAGALAAVLLRLAGDRAELDRLRERAYRLAREEFEPGLIVAPLAARLRSPGRAELTDTPSGDPPPAGDQAGGGRAAGGGGAAGVMVGRVSWRVAASRWAKPVFLVITLAFCGYGLLAERAGIAAALHRLAWYPVAGALLMAIAGLGCMMLSWRAILADLGSALPVRTAAGVLFVAQLAKCIPGAVWTTAAQVGLGRQHQVPGRRSAAAAAVSLLVSLAAALLTAAVVLPLSSAHAARTYWWALALAVPALAGLYPPLTNSVLDRLLRLAA